MLEFDNGQKLMNDLWDATATKVELPDDLKPTYFGVQGPAPLYHDNRRTFHRYYMRGKAVLKRGAAMIGTYTKDVSRQGVAFLSPVPVATKRTREAFYSNR